MPKRPRPKSGEAKATRSKKKSVVSNEEIEKLMDIAIKLRIHSIEMTEKSKSGHPTTCSSIAEIMAALFFSPCGMKFNPMKPKNLTNDRLVLSKGHAAPILYASWAEAGLFPKEDLLNLRKIDSDLEGHPTPRLNFVDVASGSLGQGICCAAGMAYAAKYFEKSEVKIFCICGDGEFSEGSCWEALQFASYYKLDNLIVIIDVNRLGQSQETPYQHKMDFIKSRLDKFGTHVEKIDGHDMNAILNSFQKARAVSDKPTVIAAKTFKGRDFTTEIEDKLNWHGKALGTMAEKAIEFLKEKIKNEDSKMEPIKPEEEREFPKWKQAKLPALTYNIGDKIATRAAYGHALKSLASHELIVALDAETKNSTMTIDFAKECPERFIECFIAEQNMIGVATGIQTRGFVPFTATFAAFHTRAYDFIRMAAISMANIKIVGSHCGVSIGVDGTSQMGLEDLAMMKPIPGSIILYPSDAVSSAKAVELMANYKGIAYLRTTREATPVVYPNEEEFALGKCKISRKDNAKLVLIGAGITYHEALKAQKKLEEENITVTLIDLFSVKPLDKEEILKCAKESNNLILTVEDHYIQGGIFESVAGAMADQKDIRVFGLGITELPRSGQPMELLEKFGISCNKIVEKVKSLI